MLTFKEIKEKMLEIGLMTFSEEDYDKEDYFPNIEIDEVSSHGGYEGGGEHMDKVFEFEQGEESIFVYMDGYHDSYGGSEWHESSIVQVYPKEKLVIVYEEKP